MLIVLHESLLSHLAEADPHRTVALRALENIAHSLWAGSHIVVSGRSVLNDLAQNTALSEPTRAAYRRTREQLPQTAHLVDVLIRRVEVTGALGGAPRVRTEGSKKVLQTPITQLTSLRFAQETTLLLENDRDAGLYERLGKVAAQKRGLRMPIRFEVVSGGGDTTADQYVRLQAHGQTLCLCIVDSDRLYPNGSIGQTARKITMADHREKPLCEFVVTRSREAENMIPTPHLAAAFENNIEARAILALLSRIEDKDEHGVRQHLDMKQGFLLKKVLALPVASPSREYWISAAERLQGDLPASIPRCLDREKCEFPDSCRCSVRGFGGDCLVSALSHLRTISTPKLGESLTPTLEPEWTEIGELVLAWCCGGETRFAA